jgi:hypothetical protein
LVQERLLGPGVEKFDARGATSPKLASLEDGARNGDGQGDGDGELHGDGIWTVLVSTGSSPMRISISFITAGQTRK